MTIWLKRQVKIMDIYSSYIMENLIEQGISVRRLSELCGINYMVLYVSLLSRSRARPLRIGEYMKICEVLNISPVVKQKSC